VSARCLLVALFLTLVGSGFFSRPAEAAGGYYQNAVIKLPSIDPAKASRYRAVVRQRSVRGRIGSVHFRDGEGSKKRRKVLSRRGKDPQLRRLPAAAVGALAHLSGPRFWGGEIDILVRVRKKGTYPVTLWFDRDGDVTVAVGKRLAGRTPEGFGKRRDADAVRRAHKTGPIRSAGRKWRTEELLILDGALARLHPAERRVLKDVRILRATLGRQPLQAGLYSMDSRGRYRLRVFNRTFVSQEHGFVGSVAKPLPRGAWTILHELGHAVSGWPARRAFEQGEVRKGRKLQRSNRVLKGYRKARGAVRGPTPYGRSSLTESFAESFALYHLDPKALARWNRDVFQWFESGGHREHLAR
jgi:hypothetical protein